MTEQYLAYLDSPEWKRIREQRLEISGRKCSACATKRLLHVHHLTYERIFKEEMSDLLPLCEACHTEAERLVKEGFLPRTGNVLFLATETVRLLLPNKPSNATLKARRKYGLPTMKTMAQQIVGGIDVSPKSTSKLIRATLASNPEFMNLIRGCSKNNLSKAVRNRFGNHKRIVNAAHICFDMYHKHGYAHKF